VTGFSPSHCGKTPLTIDYLPIMIPLQNILVGTRSAPPAAVLRPDFFRDGLPGHIAPATLDWRTGTYPDTAAGFERDVE
jgi:hypothetical protein